MIQHHQGALTMVRQLYAARGGGGAGAGCLRAAREADQQIEIARMHGGCSPS